MARGSKTVLIHAESKLAQDLLYDRVHPFGAVIPRRFVAWFMSRRLFPNTGLAQLHRRGEIRLIDHRMPDLPAYGAPEADSIPIADTWLFSLMNFSNEAVYSPAFFERARARAATHGIRIINLVSHVDDGVLPVSSDAGRYPRVAKLRGNGLVGDFTADSFTVLADPQAEDAWRARVGNEADYVVQPFLHDRRSRPEDGLYCVERWIAIGSDLTVGLRRSTQPLVKQTNSVTTYARDARNLVVGEEFQPLRDRLRAQELRFGCLPITFEYREDADFWDARLALLARHRAETGFELGSLDVLETADDGLVIIDYNEATAESAHPDLFDIWTRALGRLVSGD